MTTQRKRILPNWMLLKCNEKLAWNPASLFSQCVAAIITERAIDGYTQLEEIQHLCFPQDRKSEPIEIIYKDNCTVLGCWDGSVQSSGYHKHTERLGHYKFWNTNCRSSRKCIEGALPHHPDTIVLNEIHERQRLKRVSQTKQFSCKRRLFD